MAMQPVEYEFPNEKDESLTEVEITAEEEVNTSIEVEPAVGRDDIQQKPKSVKDGAEDKKIEAGEVEIEVEDDTPPEDRGRKPSEPPAEVTTDELENYSDKVKKRIQHFSKGYHDERRAKEQALREREAAEAYAKQLIEENNKLKESSTKNQSALLESAKRQVEAELSAAKRAYKDAYESGETDAIVEAQQQLNSAQIRMDKVKSFVPTRQAQEKPLQSNTNTVQQQVQAPSQQEAARDLKAEAWRDENSWFGSDDEMTAFALGYHNKLVKEGVDPQSDDYYEKINSRMRNVFPDQFDDGIDEPEEPKKKSSNVVAPATRSTSPNKVRLTQSQIAIAKRLNVPLDVYAKQVAQLSRNT